MTTTTPHRTPLAARPRPAVESGADFRRIYFVLSENKRYIVFCTLFFMALALAYVLTAKKIYNSHATLVVELEDRKVVNNLVDSQDVTQNDMHTLEVMKTVEQGLMADALVLDVIKKNDLANNPHFAPKALFGPITEDTLLRVFAKNVTVKLRRGTRLIDVTAESDDPALAKQIAQSLVDEYLRQGSDQVAGVSAGINGYLTGEAAELRDKLAKAEQALQKYQEQNNAVSLEDKQNIIVETLKDLNLKLNAARGQRMQLESDYAQYQQLGHGDPKALLALSAVANSSSVLQAEKNVQDQEALVAMLTRRYRPEHPKYIQGQSQLAQAKSDLNTAILGAADTIGIAYNTALANEHKLEDALHSQEKLSLELNKIAIPYKALEREVESDRALYQPIVNRLKENDVSQALNVSPVRLVEPARVASEPTRPKKVLILLAAMVVGFGTGVGRCLLRNANDTSMKSVDEAESALGLPVLTAVPRLSKKSKGERAAVVMVSEPSSLTAETFRSLRAMLSLKEAGQRQVLLFTSAAPAEGKSFCSINCAVAFAQQGYRTLLVDADLRRPTVATTFGRDPKTAGLTNCLAAEIPLEQAIQTSDIENLSLLTAGRTARNPAELLTASRLAALFESAALDGFDRVVFDTAPVNAVSDALALVKYAHSVLLVVQAGRTPARASQRAHSALVAAGATDVGVVLNRVPQHAGAGCFYHYADSYGSMGVYGASGLAKA